MGEVPDPRTEVPWRWSPPGTREAGPISELAGLPRLLTTSDLADLFHISEVAARRLLSRKELPWFRMGRRKFVRREALLVAFFVQEKRNLGARDERIRLLREWDRIPQQRLYDFTRRIRRDALWRKTRE